MAYPSLAEAKLFANPILGLLPRGCQNWVAVDRAINACGMDIVLINSFFCFLCQVTSPSTAP